MVFAVALMAMVLAMAMLPGLSALARRVGVLALPEARKVHEGAIPQIGGVAIVSSALVGASLMMPPSPDYLAYLVGAALVFGVGLFDDYQDLEPRTKFLVQFTAAGIAVIGGGMMHVSFNAPVGVLPVWLGAPFAVVALVQITNAVNLADGLDGLAGGLALLSCLALAICGVQAGSDLAVVVALMIAGSVVGFLRFNTHPARVFMGDNGAYFLGFSLGFIALDLCSAGRMSLTAMVMMLGVPVLDALFVPVLRFFQGRPLFRPDRSHLHHRLLQAGFSHRSSVALIYAFHSAFLMIGYVLRNEPEWLLLPVFLIVSVVVEGSPALLSPLRRWLKERVQQMRPSAWLDRGLVVAAMVSLLAATVVAAVSTPVVSIDFMAGSTTLLVVLVGWMAIARSRELGWVDRCALYVLGAYCVYFGSSTLTGARAAVDVALFGTIGFWLVFRLIGTRARGFALTPLDLIVVVTTGAVALLGRGELEALTLDVVKLVVWFYAVELLAAEPGRAGALRLLAFVGLGLITARGALGMLS
jgi:UDP-GlcNAc:undecaprenyl-phosphate/decaprenyl-phosphate GlcNAc-1-phosphate transferase